MKKSRFAEEQIIGILKEQEAGAKAQDLCRLHGISGTTFFKWKARFGGLEPSDAKRLRTLEDENRRLKKLLAEQMLDNAALKDLVGKTSDASGVPCRSRHVMSHHGLSERRAAGFSRSIGRRCEPGRRRRSRASARARGRASPDGKTRQSCR